MRLLDHFLKDVGIDLGTANTRIYLRGQGMVINEPTVVAMNNKSMQVLAVGDEAKKMFGRTPGHISVVRPLTGGVVSDFDMTQELLHQLLRRLHRNSLLSFRRAVVAIPDNLTEVERKSVEDAVVLAGCAKALLIPSPVAAAIGAGLPTEHPTANLIVDIGGGTTDIAVISMGGAVIAKTLKVAGDKMNDDIMRFIREEFKLAVGETTAEMAKIMVGSAIPLEERLEVPIRGRDIATGLPKEVTIKNNQVRAAISKSVKVIVDSVREVLESTPPELVGDMLKQGIWLCGGGALLRGVERLIEKEVSVRTIVADDPMTCVVRGLGRIVEDFERHQAILDNPLKPPVINL